MINFELELDNKLWSKVDFNECVKVENGSVKKLHLLEKVKPTVTNNSCLNILYAKFNPQLYKGDVEGTFKGWDYLESKQIALEEVSEVLAIYEILSATITGYLPVIPSITFPAKLAFLVDSLNKKDVGNLESQIPKLRKRIGDLKKGAIRPAIKELKSGTPSLRTGMQLKITLASIESELWICKELAEKNFDVSFNPHKEGPDLYLNGKVKVEVTTKIGWLNLQEQHKRWMKIAQENPKIYLPMLLSLTLADKIEKEFKQGEIVIVDISRSLEGFLLLASKYFSKKPTELELVSAMDQALDLVDKGERAVVFYSNAGDASGALCVDAKTINRFGQL